MPFVSLRAEQDGRARRFALVVPRARLAFMIVWLKRAAWRAPTARALPSFWAGRVDRGGTVSYVLCLRCLGLAVGFRRGKVKAKR